MADSGGLYLQVNANGSKLWYLKYRYLGKEKKLAFGPLSLVSLAEAREARDKAKKELLAGKDPSVSKQEAKRRRLQQASNTFQIIAMDWLDHSSGVWAEGTCQTKLRRMEMYLFPIIGHLPITEITPLVILDCLKEIEKKGAYDVARRLKQVISRVFQYALLHGKVSGDPTPALHGALKPVKRGHFAAISTKELPDFIFVMNQNKARLFPQTRIGMELLLLTFVRTIELIAAKWDEIDLDEAMWIIPAERMKTRQEHMVPLSRQSIERFRTLKELANNSDWVFPSISNSRKHISNNTILQALKRIGYGGRMTGHGFRSLAMSSIKEKLRYRHEVVDRQLAHVHHNSVTRAYDRAQWIDDRKTMMQEWADYIDSLKKELAR